MTNPKSPSNNPYQKTWDDFYSDTDSEVFWDSTPDEKDLEFSWCIKHFEQSRPVLDLGCGSAIRTRFLKTKFERVIGVDVSKAAIAKAKTEVNFESGLSFEVFNATNVKAAQVLNKKHGDLNVYMRAVWHVMTSEEDKQNFAHTLKILIGEKGVLVMNELDDESMLAWKSIIEAEGAPPSGFEKVMRHQIKPGDITEAQVMVFFKDYSIAVEKSFIQYTYQLKQGVSSGEFVKIPTFLMRISKN